MNLISLKLSLICSPHLVQFLKVLSGQFLGFRPFLFERFLFELYIALFCYHQIKECTQERK